MPNTAEIVLRAAAEGVAIPAFNIPYLPIMKPVVEAVVDTDCFALIAVARPEWVKFQAGSIAEVRAEFEKWRDPAHLSLIHI